jgi:hypothetical protein
VVACLWLGDNSDIVYGKTSTSNILTVKLVVALGATANRVSDFVAATNPNLVLWAL